MLAEWSAKDQPAGCSEHIALPSNEFFHVLRATPDDVRQALRAAVARFARAISPNDAGTLELTLAEVLNNIVEHAYADEPGGPVVLHVVRDANAMCCRVTDRGRPMPDAVVGRVASCSLDDAMGQMPDVAVLVDDLPEGGYGWPLVRAMTEDLGYVRHGQMNVLSFRLQVSAA